MNIQAAAPGSDFMALWLKLGGAAVSGSKTTSMLVRPGSILHPLILGVGTATHLSVFADGGGTGDMLLTPGRIVEGAATGATGEAAGLGFTFSDTTAMADPGSGLLRFDDATVASVSNIAIDDESRDGVDVSTYLVTFDDSTSTIKGYLTITVANDPSKIAIFQVDSLTDNSGWVQLGVTHVASAGTIANDDEIQVEFQPNGTNDGVTSSAIITDNAIVRGDGGARGVQDSAVLVDDFGNITPDTDDGGALGTTSLKWSDAFFASGAVINFNAGNFTITHSAGLLTFSGSVSLGTGNALTVGTVELGHASDTTLSRDAAGVLAVEGVQIGRVGEVTTLSALKALGAGDYDVAIMQGYSSAGDGGGGTFRWDGSDLSTEVSGDSQSGIYVPPDSDATGTSGAWVRIYSGAIHVGWFGLAGDGTTDETSELQSIFDFAQNEALYFPAGSTYAFGAGETGLRIRQNTKIINAGSVFRLTTSISTNAGTDAQTPSILIEGGGFVDINYLRLELPAGITVNRGIEINSKGRIGLIEAISTDQLDNGTSGLPIDGFVRIEADDFHLGRLYMENIDYTFIIFRSLNTVVDGFEANSYRKGVRIRESDNGHIGKTLTYLRSPNATGAPGETGINLEGATDYSFGPVQINGAGEHSVRIGGTAGNNERITFSTVQCFKPGRSGFKVKTGDNGDLSLDLTVGSIHVIDAGDITVTPGINEDGVKLHRCLRVSIGSIHVTNRSNARSCHTGIQSWDAEKVSIGFAEIFNAENHFVHLSDTNPFAAETGGRILEWHLGTLLGNNAGSDAINIDSPTEVIRDVKMPNVWLRGHSGFGVNLDGGGGVFQPLIIKGSIDPDGTGTVSSNVTGNSAVRFDFDNGEILTIADGDATPDVGASSYYQTSNTGATTITDLDGADNQWGKTVTIEFGDTNTTVDFTASSLMGNAGVDWSPASGDHMTCRYNGTNWLCDISDNTA